MPKKIARAARRQLDRRFAGLREAIADQPRPAAGWIRAIRDALGMSTTELAARMGLSQSSAAELEHNEARGSIRVDTLARAADALDCDVVYFLLPRTDLESAVRAQARRQAVRRLAPVVHSMRLEDEAVDDGATAEQLDDLADRFVDRRGLWTDPQASPATGVPAGTSATPAG